MQGGGHFIERSALIGGQQSAGIVLRFFRLRGKFQRLGFFEQLRTAALPEILPERVEFQRGERVGEHGHEDAVAEFQELERAATEGAEIQNHAAIAALPRDAL